MTPPYARMIAPLPRPEDARPFDAAAFERDLRRLRDELTGVPQTGVSDTPPVAPIGGTVPVGPTVPDAVSDALSEKRCADG